MNLELLDELESKVDNAVNTVTELRSQNELLKGESQGLEEKIRSLAADLQAAGESQSVVDELRAKCEDLEARLGRVRGRIEGMVDKMKALEA
jgi:FtsZ-binding cell division protein ZapB